MIRFLWQVHGRHLLLLAFVASQLCLVGGRASLAVENDAWLQWRGPNRDGTIANANWPTSLNESHLEEVWRVELGPSYSGPLVDDDRVYVTETVNERSEVVRALDRATGQKIWEQEWIGAISVPFFAKENGDWIRSTPAIDGDRLYVAGIRDVLVCLSTETGEVMWSVDFVEALGTEVPSFGCATSPMILGDYVYVQSGDGFAKVDKMTGELIWRILENPGGMSGGAFSSPVYATIHGRPQIVVQTRTTLAGVDEESGEVLWKTDVPAFRGMNILTPTIIDNQIFTSTYGNKSYLYEVTESDGNWGVSLKWENRQQGYMSSPVVVGDSVYLHLRNGRFTCIDVATGESRWTTTPYGKYWSMIAQGNHILALDQRGDLMLIDASPDEFKLVDSRSVSEDSWAHLAIVGDLIVVRELNAIAVYRWQ